MTNGEKYTIDCSEFVGIAKLDKKSILDNVEEFFGVKYHQDKWDWGIEVYPFLAVSMVTTITGCKKISSTVEHLEKITYNEMLKKMNKSEIGWPKENHSYDESLI